MKKLLIANRGEIAVRIIRSAKEMGIKTVAVYSDADRFSPHVLIADEAYRLGPPPSSESYLLGDLILEICKKHKIDAIHPGYGFLSENAVFRDKVESEGMIFVGPSSSAMSLMGSKLAAKAAVKSYNVPLVPGTDTALESVEEGMRVAKEIGFPVLVKASAGGGGKGMRLVEREEDFSEQMQRAVSEAESSFGDGRVFIEKYVLKPRHIEIQVLGDQHGNHVHLFERECSIQRRHQKVVEEAPSALLTDDLRKRMGDAAIQVCKACNYSNAGTVEFLVDANNDFYFLEMNTRLQVEHPVTELITGIDLVKEQIRVARGEKLGYSQEDLSINGHSIEVRVYAEDPLNNFLPDIGRLEIYQPPKGNGVRVDDGFEQGMDIPIYYDPMIAKLITFGKDRADAISKMKRAISEYQIKGIKTTLPFGTFVMNHPKFIEGDFDTGFIGTYFTKESLDVKLDKDEELIGAALAGIVFSKETSRPGKSASEINSSNDSNWIRNRKK